MDWVQYRRRMEQLDRDKASLYDFVEELRTKRRKGEITEEEWERWGDEIRQEIANISLRTSPDASEIE